MNKDLLQEDWPTESLKKTIQRIGVLPESEFVFNFPSPAEHQFKVIGSTEKKAEFAFQFLPQIYTIGLELYEESKSPAWTGIQYQVLESINKQKRLVQTLLIWTKQKTIFSRFYTILIPLLLAFISILIVSIVKSDSRDQGETATFIITGILIIAGLLFYLRFIWNYLITRRFSLYIPMILPIYGILYFITVYDISEKLKGNGFKTLSLESINIEIYVSVVAIIFIGFAIVSWLFSRILGNIKGINRLLGSHIMDYEPIWIFLTKKDSALTSDANNFTNWKIEKVYFDNLHYEIGKATLSQLQSQGAIDKKNHIRPILEIDNNWHSFNVRSSQLSIPMWFKILLIAFSSVGLILTPFILREDNSLIIMLSVLFVLLVIGLWLVIARFEYHLVSIHKMKIEDLDDHKMILSPTKLNILWNLQNDESRLKIRTKITQPFSTDFINTWYDE